MKNLTIDVSSIVNLVSNSDFSRWNQNVPTGWTVTNNSGTVIPYPFEGGFACGIDEIESETETYIQQEIGSLDSGDNISIQTIHKGDINILIQKDDSGWSTVHTYASFSQSWITVEYSVEIDATKQYRVLLVPNYQTTGIPLNDNVLINILNIYKSNWYDEKKPLKVDEISRIENLSREIEDDIFTFKSDAMDFEIYNYQDSYTGYFNPEDFITNSERIFRFDIKIEYDESISKNIILFSNNDTIKRVQIAGSDTIQLSLYELPTIFKDNGWFLGELTQDIDDDSDPEGDPYFLYKSHEDGNTGYDVNVPISDSITALRTDIFNLMKQRVIPVRDSDFTITNNLSANSQMVSLYYNDKIGSGSDEYYILDYVVSPTNRVFLLLVPSNTIDASIQPTELQIYELINGSSLENTGKVVPLFDSGYYLGQTLNVAFLHTYDTDYYDSGEEIEFAISVFGYVGLTYRIEFFEFTNDAESNSNLKCLNNCYPFPLIIETEYDEALTYKTAYINVSGDVDYYSYDSSIDNTYWIYNNPTASVDLYSQHYNFDSTIAVNNNSQGDMYDYYYADSLIVTVPRFPQYYSFKLKNVTPSDMLKEFAITQDAVWFLSYSGSQITVNIYVRDTSETYDDYWDDTDWIIKEQYVRMIKFDDLDSQLFNQDFERMKDFVGYYNNRYGNGRTEIDAREWGWHDYGLRDIVRYDNKTYFIKQVELENYDYATNFRMFELWQ